MRAKTPLEFVLSERSKPQKRGDYYIPRQILEMAGATCSSYLKMSAKSGLIEVKIENHEELEKDIEKDLHKAGRKLPFANIENKIPAVLFEKAGFNPNQAEFHVKPGLIEIKGAV